MKEARKKETATKEEDKAERPKETTKDMVTRWMKDDGGQVAPRMQRSSYSNRMTFFNYIYIVVYNI
jgi:hypothetical protein